MAVEFRYGSELVNSRFDWTGSTDLRSSILHNILTHEW